MNIVPLSNSNGVPFSSLESGEVFSLIGTYEDVENGYFMRIDDNTIGNTTILQNHHAAIRLFDGVMLKFNDDRRVMPVEGYFKITSITVTD